MFPGISSPILSVTLTLTLALKHPSSSMYQQSHMDNDVSERPPLGKGGFAAEETASHSVQIESPPQQTLSPLLLQRLPREIWCLVLLQLPDYDLACFAATCTEAMGLAQDGHLWLNRCHKWLGPWAFPPNATSVIIPPPPIHFLLHCDAQQSNQGGQLAYHAISLLHTCAEGCGWLVRLLPKEERTDAQMAKGPRHW